MTTPEFSRGLPTFAEAISKTFGFLFTDFGFAVVHQEDSWGEHGLVVLESKDCRVKFVFDRGAVQIFLGRKDAAPTWSDGSGARKAWFYLQGVVDFLEGRPKRSLAQLLTEGEQQKGLSEGDDLAQAAELLRPVGGEAFRLFGQDDQGGRWSSFVSYYTDHKDLSRELREKHGGARRATE